MIPSLTKINKYKVLFAVLVAFIFIEIIIISPTILEKTTEDYSYESDLASSDETRKNMVEQKLKGAHFLENGDGEKGWQMFASEATGSNGGQWVLKQVKVEFFSENLSSFVVTGDVGEVDGQTKNLQISGNVTTTSSNGYSFKTDTLRYLAKQKIMTSLDAVVMQGPADKSGSGFVLNGEKLLVDVDKNKMSILDKVSAKKVINKKNFNLTSVRADFSNKNQEAVFTGGVKMSLGTMQMSAPVANFSYQQSTKTLTKIVLSNGVQFSEADRKGICNELIINLADNSMLMRGQPKVQLGEDEIKGYEIVFLDGGKKVKINKAPN